MSKFHGLFSVVGVVGAGAGGMALLLSNGVVPFAACLTVAVLVAAALVVVALICCTPPIWSNTMGHVMHCPTVPSFSFVIVFHCFPGRRSNPRLERTAADLKHRRQHELGRPRLCGVRRGDDCWSPDRRPGGAAVELQTSTALR